jgi:hypothetical protein
VQDGEVDELPTPIVNRPVEARSSDPTPVVNRPVEARSSDPTPVVNRPVESRSSDATPVVNRPVESRSSDATPVVNRPAESRSFDPRPSEVCTPPATPLLRAPEAQHCRPCEPSLAADQAPHGVFHDAAGDDLRRDTAEQLVLRDDVEERRRHPRAPVELLVGLKFDSVQHFLAMYAEDISESGMFLRSEHAGALRSIGEELELRFDAGNRRIVQGRGRVVRVIEPGDPTNTAGIGIQFVELDDPSRKLVEAIVRIKLASVRTG